MSNRHDTSSVPSKTRERGLNRRGFLKVSSAAAALAAAGSAFADSALADESTSRSAKTRGTAPASGNKDIKGGWFIV